MNYTQLMNNKTKIFVGSMFLLGIIIGGAIFYFYTKIPKLQPTTSLSTTNTQPPPLTTSTASTITANLKNIPIAVGFQLGVDWFNSWATKNDLMVIFGVNFTDTTHPKTGQLAWNAPSFTNVMSSVNQWKGKVNTVLYDYETWEKTPASEQADPAQAARTAQSFCDANGIQLIMGASWKMVTVKGAAKILRGNPAGVNWSGIIDKAKIQSIAKSVRSFGVNASGLRRENPEQYIDFFNLVASYAKEVNPTIKLWPVLDARSQSADKMLEMVNKLQGNIDGVTIMGNEKDKAVISSLISMLRK